ncbi:MAG: hypothetical protein AUH94_00485 [Ktedonobacter sp. 13_2_20CM_2_54_8]|nr:MAG: hypothetical protein AUH05_08985 [Ktedonobacter sp. 13_2_20CM_53_11]OLB65658.1 MAG: hypothetical protein AUH94_00485 [Ktedonobacter sp. 13_2_20CM_2_54_8]TMC23951.1 MAG: hypothetical protein E6J36_08635 [Chloroflexota bacterium]
MSRKNPVRAAKRTNSRLQAFLLLILGVFCLLAAWLLHPNAYAYPVGVLVLGLGMLLAAALNPYRLMIGGILTTFIGIAVFLSFKPVIPVLRGQDLVTFLLAIGLALLGIALMTRRGYIGAGAVTPGLIVVAVAIIELLLAEHLTPGNFVPFMLSLWLPGIGLLVLGLIYVAVSMRV